MSEHEKITSFLHTVPLFNGLDEPHLQRLGKRFTERSYAKGQAIVNQGTLGIGLFIVESGAAEAVRHETNGSTNVVNNFKPTEYFGELSLLDEAPRTATVVATEETKCLVLTQLDFLSALREDSEIPIIMLREMAKRFRRAIEAL
jgi:CRP/FNR family transcriptional regulator, cyclic AMP receptor protein